MKKIIPVIDRIKKSFEIKSEGDVANLLGISKTALANHKSRDTIPYDALFTFCEKKGISLDWLFTGEGNFKRDSISELSGGIVDKGYVLISANSNSMHGCQGGASEMPPDEIIAFKKDWIVNELPASPEDLKVFQIIDDTMEPTFRYGDLVVIDCKHCNENKAVTIKDGIYLLSLDGHQMIKRLQILPEGLIQVVSDNQVYRPFLTKSDLFPDKAQIVGRVVWAGRKMR